MDPATIAAIGTAAQGAGSLLSAFGVGRKKGPSMEEQLAVQGWWQRDHEMKSARNLFDTKMQLAQQHGLHPLSVLGVSTGSSFSPVLTTGVQDTGPDFASIGYGANQIAKSFIRPETAQAPQVDAREDRIIDANLRLAEANAKRAEWEALGSEFRVADMAAPRILLGQPGNPPGVRASNDVVQMENLVAEQSGIPRSYVSGQGPITVEQKVAPPHPLNVGHAAGTDQGWQRVQDKNGNQVSVIRNDAVNADIEKGATFQALASIFGIDRAMQITAIMENEGLLMGGAVAAGYGVKKLYEYVMGRAKGGPPQRYTPQWKKGGR